MTRFDLGYWLVVGGGSLILLAVAVRSMRLGRVLLRNIPDPFTRRRPF